MGVGVEVGVDQSRADGQDNANPLTFHSVGICPPPQDGRDNKTKTRHAKIFPTPVMIFSPPRWRPDVPHKHLEKTGLSLFL